MTPQLVLALVRGLIVSLATGGLALFSTYTASGSWRLALVAGGSAACGRVLAELAATGAIAGIQSNRQAANRAA